MTTQYTPGDSSGWYPALIATDGAIVAWYSTMDDAERANTAFGNRYTIERRPY